jgi:hypothetical protein
MQRPLGKTAGIAIFFWKKVGDSFEKVKKRDILKSCYH